MILIPRFNLKHYGITTYDFKCFEMLILRCVINIIPGKRKLLFFTAALTTNLSLEANPYKTT